MAEGSPSSSEHEGELAPGDSVGRYTVVRRLGSGAMGVVVAAFDHELNRRVAIKLLRRSRLRSRSTMRLQREAQAMAQVSHLNVVAVYDVGRHGLEEQVFIAMEFVDGPTLSTWMAVRHHWRETLELIIGAGRGLEAAHAAGLIHRDFKPDNVLITAAGVAKVSDFGLVRTAGDISTQSSDDSEEELEPLDPAASSSAGTMDLLMAPLTRVGALLGTPGFMAPEQFRGQRADAAADQFAFCVVLYIALYGARPFAGKTIDELHRAVVSGDRLPLPPSERNVPGWLSAIVERGLSQSPADRWPSMSALLQALENDPSARRKRWLSGAGAVAVLAAVGLGGLSRERAQRARCEAAGEVATERWIAATSAVHGALLATELPFAADTWTRSEAAFGAWAERWRGARVMACSEAREDRPQAEDTAACLDAQLDDLGATLTVLSSSDRITGSYAIEAITLLPPPERCADPLWLNAWAAVGDDDEQREQASVMRRALVQTELLNQAGKFHDALERARATLVRAPPEGPLHAEAHLVRGKVATETSRYAEALEALEAAYFEADAIGLDRVALLASLELSWVHTMLGHSDLSAQWLRQGRALVRRLGSRREDLVEVDAAAARKYTKDRDFEAAEASARAYLEGAEALYPATHPKVADALVTLGKTQLARGRSEEATATFARARTAFVDSFGAAHPKVATLDLEAARAKSHSGDIPGALEDTLAALERIEAIYGTDDLTVYDALQNVAETLARASREGEALTYQIRAVAVAERLLGPDTPTLAVALNTAARMLRSLGRFDEAKAALERSEGILLAAYGPEHIETVITVYELARLRGKQGAPIEELLPIYERVYERFAEVYGLEHDNSMVILSTIGRSKCALGRYDAGLADLERVVQLAARDSDGGKVRLTVYQSILIGCQFEAQRWSEALPVIRAAIEVREAELGDEDPARLSFRISLVEALLETGDYAGALAAADEARTIFEQGENKDISGRVDYRCIRARVLATAGHDLEAARALITEGLAELAERRDQDIAMGQSPEILDGFAAKLRSALDGEARARP